MEVRTCITYVLSIFKQKAETILNADAEEEIETLETIKWHWYWNMTRSSGEEEGAAWGKYLE